MKVKHLQELLTKINPEALVVLSWGDHAYRELRRADETVAEYNKAEKYLGETYEDQELLDGSVIVPVVVIA